METRRSELRSYELSTGHYAHGWKVQLYAVADTNTVVNKYCASDVPDEKNALSMELIKRFHSTFYKYLKLLITGQPDLNNRRQREFLSLLAPKTGQSYLKTASNCTIAFRDDSPDDIYNQLVLIFLQLLDNYNPMLTIGFVHYINCFFKYSLKRFIIGRYYDALDYQELNSEDISGTTKDKVINGLKLSVAPTQETELEYDIDLTSTSGLGVMRDLTSMERYVVYLIANKGYRRVDVMKLFGFTDNNRIHNIVSKIKKKIAGAIE